jgi:glyoxylase-like metal-dependent hydrolase (beta-lactamase superfamily II)
MSLVERILASVQWDRWIFPISFSKPINLVNQKVAVISHEHRDHWIGTERAELVLYPKEVHPPYYGRSLLPVGEYPERIDKLVFVKLNKRRIERLIGKAIPRPHAFFWLIDGSWRGEDARILFVGDMNLSDVRTVQEVVEKITSSTFLNAVILPSFGGVNGHGGTNLLLALAVDELARELKEEYKIMVNALPHPVPAKWATYNAADAVNQVIAKAFHK